MRKYLLPLFFIFLFIAESIFVQTLPTEMFESERIIVPHFLLIGLLFLTVYGQKNWGIIYSLCFGLLFDVVYTEIIGIYLFMLPLLSYLCTKLMKFLQSNIIIVSIIVNLAVILLEVGVYEMNTLLNITDMHVSTFWHMRLFPTMILNLTFTILFAYPFKKLFEKTVHDAKGDSV